MAFTKPLTVNGAANLLTLMKAAGYTGNGQARMLRLFNPSAATPLYVHYTADGTAAPAGNTDGIPVGAATTDQGMNFELVTDGQNGMVDLGLIWVYTAGSINIKCMAVSA